MLLVRSWLRLAASTFKIKRLLNVSPHSVPFVTKAGIVQIDLEPVACVSTRKMALVTKTLRGHDATKLLSQHCCELP